VPTGTRYIRNPHIAYVVWSSDGPLNEMHAMTNRRKAIPLDIKQQVLHEAGYRCGNPVCRHVITLDIHHLEFVSEGGPNSAENLLPLCPNCHGLHHSGEIPVTSLRAWKMLLLTLNEAFDKKSLDILLALDKLGKINRITGDGVIDLAPLVASGFVEVKDSQNIIQSASRGQQYEVVYCAELTPEGKLLVDSWKEGDQETAVTLVAR
jgi:hypothetical protein